MQHVTLHSSAIVFDKTNNNEDFDDNNEDIDDNKEDNVTMINNKDDEEE